MTIDIESINLKKITEEVKAVISDRKRYAYVLTFGCQQNEADSEKIRGLSRLMGYDITDTPENADLIVVNTCAIRKHAEMKALSTLGRFKALKKKKPDLIIGVVGCMAAEAHVADMLKKDFHYISFTLEPGQIHNMPKLIRKSLYEHKRSFVFEQDCNDIIEGIEQERLSQHKAWVSVMYGCNNFCTYCIVPYVRGGERSRDSKAVIRECEELIKKGYKEITLLGQNVNSYKSDTDFAELLERVANIEGDFIIRFMTSHPKDVSDRLISVLGRYKEKIAPCFHLPLQSGSDSILKKMNRTYNTEGYLDTVRKIREAVPGIALTSDIIVGFPGESEDDFKATLNILSCVRFDMVYSFIYSLREGTKAAVMENQIDDITKSERMTRLLELQCKISLEKNMEYVGKTVKVLVDSVKSDNGKRICSARTLSNKLVHFENQNSDIGEFTNVKIVRAGDFELYGEKTEREIL